MVGDVVVDLARAEHEPFHELVIGARVVEDGLEGALGEVGERRGGALQPQQAFRRHQDERPRNGIERLAADEVEELRGGRAVRDAHVVLRGELQVALEARARVLGAVALVAVWQQHRQARRLVPLGKARRDELVDDDLGAVAEVTELGFPDHERLGCGDGVAVLEAEHCVLGQRRVVYLEGRLRLADALHRRVGGAGVRVVQDEVAVREGAALAVLPGHADRDALGEEARERERLGLAPLDAALVEGDCAALQLLGELRVGREALGEAQQLGVEAAQLLAGDRGDDDLAGGGGWWRCDIAGGDRLAERGLEALVSVLDAVVDIGDELGRRRLRDDAVFDELPGVELADAGPVADLADGERLRVGRLVGLVVAEAAVADEVDDDIVGEALAERHREPDRVQRGLGIVGIDVDDRDVEPLRQIARVAGRAGLVRVGREADLVVRDQVDRAARLVAGEPLEVERLGDDPLAGERGVAVNEDR